MNIGGLAGFPNINSYVKDKVERMKSDNKDFKTLFNYMFSEEENVMAEYSEGAFIKKITYGECRMMIRRIASHLKAELRDIETNSVVGLYMSNSIEWIEIFWALLMCGYRPILMNSRLPHQTLEDIVTDHAVRAVISDGEEFETKMLFSSDIISGIGDPLPNESEAWADEMVFMSSGTSNNVKLCFYNGENLCYQVCDTLNIIELCPQIRMGYEGNIKQLALLPFYHIFGFVAVYVWFGFFARTFVFLKDMNPNTIQATIKRHKVTHIFAVPMVWDKVYRAAMKKISSRGASTLKKFNKALALSNRSRILGGIISKKAFCEVRDNLFGDSVQFMISGGSSISYDVLSFFNGIGYRLANGYGMTEIGISSVELSSNKPMLNSASIGAPFGITEYKINEETGELLVRSKTMAYRIVQGEDETVTDYGEFFNTHDLASCKNGRYYLDGRHDDLIICESGENLNPTLAEQSLRISGCDGLCIFTDANGNPTLLISAQHCYTPEHFDAMRKRALKALQDARLDGQIKRIAITVDKLISGSDFKLNRSKVSSAFANGEYSIYDPENKDITERTLSRVESTMRECFAEALGKTPEEIGAHDDFFVDLGGTSLDYFILIDNIKMQFDVDFTLKNEITLSTLHDLCEFIKSYDTVTEAKND